MHATIYELNGTLLIPTPAVSDRGWDVRTDPVFVLDPRNVDELAVVLQRTMLERPKTVSHEAVLALKIPSIVLASKCRNWKQFARSARCWFISIRGDSVVVVPTSLKDDGFVPRDDAPLVIGRPSDWVGAARGFVAQL